MAEDAKAPVADGVRGEDGGEVLDGSAEVVAEGGVEEAGGEVKPVRSASAQWGAPAEVKEGAHEASGGDDGGEDEGEKRARRRPRLIKKADRERMEAEAAEKNEGGEDGEVDAAGEKQDEVAEEGEKKVRPRRRRRLKDGDGEDAKSGYSGDGGGRRGRERAGGDDGGAKVEAKKSERGGGRRGKRGGSKAAIEKGSKEWSEIFSDKTFADLGLRNSVCKSVAEYGYEHATHIQAQLIPAILAGKDVLGQARTGTGKTAAFGMPLFHTAQRQLPFQSVVLAPTRELAIQIAAELDHLGRWTPIRVAAVYGGKQIASQVRELETGPDIIVATPGRLIDMVERKVMHLKNVRQIVLDEVDRMLDIGFRDDIRRILSMVKSKEHQTIFVSATISEEIEKLAKSFMKDPEDIRTTTGSLTVSLVKQHYITAQPWDKRPMLIHLLKDEQPELCIIFCQMKRTVDKIAMRLKEAGMEAVAIHGDMMQRRRNSVIRRLRDGELHLVVASDLAARGLDVDGITHVINFDLPEDPEVYIHRIGRTARAGRAGKAYSLVTPEQGPLLTAIEHEANAHIEQVVFDDFVPGDVPDEVQAERETEAKRIEDAQALNRFAVPDPPKVEKADASKFPGGVVPSKLPPKLMRGRVKTSRSVKADAADARIKGRE